MYKSLLAFLIFFLTSPGQAEYRAFHLKVYKDDIPLRDFTTTLDHYQYPQYYPLAQGERIEYVDSWMCWGRTEAFEPPCQNPENEP